MQLLTIRDKAISPDFQLSTDGTMSIDYHYLPGEGMRAMRVTVQQDLDAELVSHFGGDRRYLKRGSLRRHADGRLIVIQEQDGDDRRALVHAVFAAPLLGSLEITASSTTLKACPNLGNSMSEGCSICGAKPALRTAGNSYRRVAWSEHPMWGSYPVYNPLQSEGITVIDQHKSRRAFLRSQTELLLVLNPNSGIRVAKNTVVSGSEWIYQWDGKALSTNFSHDVYPPRPPSEDPGTII